MKAWRLYFSVRAVRWRKSEVFC